METAIVLTGELSELRKRRLELNEKLRREQVPPQHREQLESLVEYCHIAEAELLSRLMETWTPDRVM